MGASIVRFEKLNDEAGVARGDQRQGAGGKGVPGKRVPEGVRGVFAAQKPEDAGGRRASAPDDVTPAPSFPGTPFPPPPKAERPKRSPPTPIPQYPPLDPAPPLPKLPQHRPRV